MNKIQKVSIVLSTIALGISLLTLMILIFR
jgi:hypothetical protein